MRSNPAKSLSSVSVIRNILGYLPRREAIKCVAVAADWREAFWSLLDFDGADASHGKLPTAALVAGALQTEAFACLCATLAIRNLPALSGEQQSQQLMNQLSDAEILHHITLTHCGLSLAQYEALLSNGLVGSLATIEDVTIGPFPGGGKGAGEVLRRFETIFSALSTDLEDQHLVINVLEPAPELKAALQGVNSPHLLQSLHGAQ
ncbi:hypothetical protein DIPPA_35969 [Diplonema papillatum]|nr:hypothetical protein DIPPA_35969 [Diplonema papillatum]